VEHIDIIVWSGHAKEGVPNPYIMSCNNLQYDHAPLQMPFESPMPTKRTTLPLPMHAVYAAQHPRKPLLTLMDKRRAVSLVFGFFKFSKHCNNILAKPVHGFMACGVAHAHVVIMRSLGTLYASCQMAAEHF
jgi:hypothetical protein